MDLRNKKAFTVAEMLIVIFIMSIITIAFVPVITQKTKADAEAAKKGASGIWQNVTNSSDAFFATASNTAGVIIGANSYADATKAKLILNTLDNTQYHILFKEGAINTLGHLALDSNAIELGDKNFAGGNSTAVGKGATPASDNSTVLGYNAIATGDSATALGSGTTASTNSTALGFGSIASNNSATAIGIGATTTGNNAVAVGHTATAGDEATAVGYIATGTGKYSTAIGESSSATGENSIAIGAVAKAPYDNSIAIGAGAVTTATNQTMLGTNAGSVYINGDLHIGGTLYLFGGVPVTLTGPASGFLHVATSDRRLKNINGDCTDGLDKVKELKPYNYTFKDDKKKTPRIGVMAQDLQKIFPNAVKKDKKSHLMIRQEDMFYAMLNSIKQLDIIAQKITKELKMLTARFMEIDTKTIALAQVDKINDKRIKDLKSEDKLIEIRLIKIEKKLKSTK